MSRRGFFVRNFTCSLFFFSTFALAQVTQEKIVDIRFVGNAVTKPQTMLEEMVVHIGDPADPGRIEISRQAIMNLGIFIEVRSELLPADGGKILQIEVKEKYYFLPIPRLNRNADGDISYGGQIRWDNIAGLNQQMKLTYETQRSAGADPNANAVKDLTLSYSYPRIMGTPYNINFSGRDTRNDINVITDGMQTAQYNHEGTNVSFTLSRFFKREGPSRGWRAGGGVVQREEKYRYVSGTPDVYTDSHTVALTGLIDYTDIRDYLYSRDGVSYGYNIERGLFPLGSDYEYLRQEFYFRKYSPVTEQAHNNLDFQLRLGFSDGVPGDTFTLGGSDTLRGYPRDSILGRSFVLANVEYLVPLFDRKELRGVIFMDVGNAYPDNYIHLSHLKSSIGLGVRFTLKSFVKIHLRVDLAYALTGDRKVYAGSKDAF
jgi:outer membrane protein assembly factor BamA